MAYIIIRDYLGWVIFPQFGKEFDIDHHELGEQNNMPDVIAIGRIQCLWAVTTPEKSRTGARRGGDDGDMDRITRPRPDYVKRLDGAG